MIMENVFWSLFKCMLYGVIGGSIISFIYYFIKKETKELSYNIFVGVAAGIILGAIVWVIACINTIKTSETRTDKQVISENKLINLKLATGMNSNFYMILGSGGGKSETDFTYFYYIEDDGVYKPQKTNFLDANIFPEDSKESEPKVVKVQTKTAKYSKTDNGWIANLLKIDLSNDYEEVNGLFDTPAIKRETIFYISKDKISNEIEPNIK